MAHARWSDLPLGGKLSVLVGTGVLALVGVATVGALAQAGAVEGAAAQSRAADAVRLTMQADMMHDAIRGDVLSALVARTSGDLTAAAAALEEHSATLRSDLAAAAGSGLGAEVTRAADAVGPDVEAYVAAADDLVRTAAQDPDAALAAYPDFGRVFSRLEQSLPTVATAIDAQEEAVRAETQAAQSTAQAVLVGTALAATALLVGLGWAVTRSVVRPLRAVGTVVAALAEGDLRAQTGVDSRDEVGTIARSLDSSMVGLRGLLATVGANATAVATATGQLVATSTSVLGLAGQSATGTEDASTTAGQVAASVDDAAAASQQLSSSVRTIAASSAEVLEVAARAVTVARSTTETVAQLGVSSQEIAGVVAVVSSIAAQTNLLALNATIEAARAGESGKGFAVVANEVKELAQETARATQDITRRVETIRADTEQAVQAIADITAIIGRIDGAQRDISLVLEQQAGTVASVDGSVGEASTGAARIARATAGVSAVAARTTEGMQEARVAIDEVARVAGEMESSISRFRW
ncbi:hypothetical protein ASG41_18745 [Modestobacter sp. Leaf380]|nr:hypothetical protein ASG41_18745 [Modestobacter sp. Leaf380]